MKVTEDMKRAAFEILNHSEMRDEAIANNNCDLLENIEEEQRSYAEALAELILKIGEK